MKRRAATLSGEAWGTNCAPIWALARIQQVIRQLSGRRSSPGAFFAARCPHVRATAATPCGLLFKMTDDVPSTCFRVVEPQWSTLSPFLKSLRIVVACQGASRSGHKVKGDRQASLGMWFSRRSPSTCADFTRQTRFNHAAITAVDARFARRLSASIGPDRFRSLTRSPNSFSRRES